MTSEEILTECKVIPCQCNLNTKYVFTDVVPRFLLRATPFRTHVLRFIIHHRHVVGGTLQYGYSFRGVTFYHEHHYWRASKRLWLVRRE